ncbi:hypothetical protein AAC387_Pa03g0487 [Persea americana]
MKSQFATFSASSYDGNALLCGAPLNKSCISTTPTIPAPEVEEEKDDNDDNLVSFYASFVGSYFVFLLGTILVLYFTSQRRAMCFFHVVDSWCAFYFYKVLSLFDLVAFLTICLELICHGASLSGLHSLNLSYNLFAGTILVTFEKLSQIESLDLSYNRLNGTIPSELTELNYLSFFSVAHNNLSGKTPDMKFQFTTFNGSSYDGNPLLCGPPLNKSCISTTHTIQAPKEEEEEDDGDDSLVSFFASFIGSYLGFLLGTVVVLYFISQRKAVFFLPSVDSWCAFRLYQVSKFFDYK